MNSRLYPPVPVIDRDQRAVNMGQQPLLIWFTGLSGSGKSTLAGMLEKELQESGFKTFLLDGDHVRSGLCNDLGFSSEDRHENIRRVGEVSRLMCDAGLIVITSFISPFRSDRDAIRKRMHENEFVEVYVNAPLEICEERDPKGLYKEARKGAIQEFTGISSPYEAPLHHELELKTDKDSPIQCLDQLLAFVLPRIRRS